MRYLVLALSLFASAAYAQQPNGIINAPIYATGYISVDGGTNVATLIQAATYLYYYRIKQVSITLTTYPVIFESI